MSLSLMPNHKTDINNNGAFSTDYIGKSWDYPEANYQRRSEIWHDHIDYVAGFFYFLAHDPQVPRDLQQGELILGLGQDNPIPNIGRSALHSGSSPDDRFLRDDSRDIQTEIKKRMSSVWAPHNSDSNVQRYVMKMGVSERAIWKCQYLTRSLIASCCRNGLKAPIS